MPPMAYAKGGKAVFIKLRVQGCIVLPREV